MTSMTSPSDTIKLRSRLSAADLGLSDTADFDRTIFTEALDRADRIDHLEILDELGFVDDLELVDDLRLEDLDVIEPPGPGSASGPSAEPSRASRAVVRLFDLTVAIIGLIVLAPLMAVVAIAVMIDSPGPIVYGSTRVGHNRPTFRAWKFRSMHTDAETDLDIILANNALARQEYETYHKLHNDPRLTRVGSLIRQTSLDELPQLVNILLGQMSVVGPRPKLLKDAAAYGDTLPAVLSVKPGLTGLWQVSGRNLLPMSDRVVLDLDYVANRTLVGDIVICTRTFIQLWRPGKHGAF